MLVLARTAAQSGAISPASDILIQVGDVEIVVTLVSIKSKFAAKIGIQAPGDVRIHRREVKEAIDRETMQ